MVLVDTSVWVDFLRTGDDGLSDLLRRNQVYIHPMIIGALACGNLKNRSQLMSLWQNLPIAVEASHQKAMIFLESQDFMGKSIGFVDLHLLAATQLTANTLLWTRDKRLQQLASALGTTFSNR